MAKFKSIDLRSYADQDRMLVLPAAGELGKDCKKKGKKRKLTRPMSTMDNKVRKKELVSQFTFNLSGYNQAY